MTDQITIRNENNQTGSHCEIYQGEIENKEITAHCKTVEFLGYSREFDHVMGSVMLLLTLAPLILAVYFCMKASEWK